ncbi:ATP-binding cassette domain-containing protein [Amorphus orientalis]|uniref:Peptide/nickel transport system ATP-binding protein n=1 Tax=Amorphus orientalis TaxID=649198 RepID=A0AAE4ARR7_9HYPH|nr:ABC transporter ATP-binding protein [Amorphus orientalis]MDQ0315416.1 peptide/nickel transport system ATP-binding protein [Amorphus orientalis]
MAEPVLEVAELQVSYGHRAGPIPALEGASVTVGAGEAVAIVGESGSGKSTLAAAVMRLLAPNGRIDAGTIRLAGEDVTTAPERRMRALRGGTVGMVFQSPRAALNPVRRIGRQIADAVRAHRDVGRREAADEALSLLEAVRIDDPGRVARSFAHELSGGMCQRAMIAIAMAGDPALLIADEPTTALDTLTGASVMDLLGDLVKARGMALVLITHDIALASTRADRIAVMEAGRVVEEGPVDAVLARPASAAARRLIAATPTMNAPSIGAGARAQLPVQPVEEGAEPLLEVADLVKRYGETLAVDRVSFRLARGESLGLVGESGAGKSTIARLVARFADADAGAIRFEGTDIAAVSHRRFHAAPERRRIQLVFQDPGESLDPRRTAFETLADPLARMDRLRGSDLDGRIAELAGQVRLDRALLDRRPHELSQGQMARVGIARALALRPKLLVLDEPTASLDVSVQAEILALLDGLRRDLGLSMLFVSHDLAVVRRICDRALVLRRGRIVEEGPCGRLFDAPETDYTRALVDALPRLERQPADARRR